MRCRTLLRGRRWCCTGSAGNIRRALIVGWKRTTPTSRSKACTFAFPLRKLVLTRMHACQCRHGSADDAEGLPSQRLARTDPGHPHVLRLSRRGVGRRCGVREATGRSRPRNRGPRPAPAAGVGAAGESCSAGCGFVPPFCCIASCCSSSSSSSSACGSGSGSSPRTGTGTGTGSSSGSRCPSCGIDSGASCCG